MIKKTLAYQINFLKNNIFVTHVKYKKLNIDSYTVKTPYHLTLYLIIGSNQDIKLGDACQSSFLFIFLEKLLSKGRLNLATSTNIKDMQLDTKNISEELLAKHLILYIYIF